MPPRLARLADVQATGIALTAEEPYGVGEPAATVIAQRLHPADLDHALMSTQLDEQTLLEGLSSIQTNLDDDAIAFINTD